MALRERTKYNLAVLVTGIFGAIDKDMEKMICAEVIDESDPLSIKNLIHADIKFPADASAEERWACMVNKADDEGLLLQFLITLLKYKQGNAQLLDVIDDFKTGFNKRVKKIAESIQAKKCVLFLGPRLLKLGTGEPFQKLLGEAIINKLKRGKIYYDVKKNDSISYLADRYEAIKGATNRDMGKLAMQIFETNKSSLYTNAHKRIAQLHFPLIISTNPDEILEQERADKYFSDFYDRSNLDKKETDFDEKKEIIYKIFGSFKNPFSILFTDNDRVQFAKNVVKNDPPLPPLIKIMLENKYYLFLGFDFEDWHLKILIDCLGLAKTDQEEKTFALLMKDVGDSSIEHFEKNYKFYFINKEVDLFLDDVINYITTNPIEP